MFNLYQTQAMYLMWGYIYMPENAFKKMWKDRYIPK